MEDRNDPGAPRPNSLVPACGVLASDGDGRLLVQRRRDTGQWALPMGKMELGETPSQCAVRETREETGILVKVFRSAYVGPATDGVRGFDRQFRATQT